MKNKFSSLKLSTVFLSIIFCFIQLCSHAQSVTANAENRAQDSAILAWLKELYEPGVVVGDDSIFLNKESERLLTDKEYRQVMYPAVYTWEAAVGFIQKQEIKKAVWFFINLYLVNDQNKELVVKSLLTYDKIFKMEKMLVSSFYTYSLTDPEVGTIEQGHSKITTPQVMDKKLNALKEMLFYLDKYKPANRKDSAGH